MAKKIKSRAKALVKATGPISDVDFPEPVAAGLRHAVRKRKDLPAEEVAEVVHKVIVGHQLQKDVAKEHRLKPVLVCQLALKAKKNSKYL